MRPSYNELLQLNPLLQRRSPEEVEALIDVIEEFGYRWDLLDKMFYNPEISHGIRTQGLDMFTPESFRDMYLGLKQEQTEHPEAYATYARYQQLWRYWFLKFVGAIFLWGIFGWIITQWRTWLLVLSGLIVAFVCFFVYCTRGFSKSGKILRAEGKTKPIVQQYSNAQAPWQLILLSIATFGYYAIYWFYRNWKHLKIHKNLNISPGWRTVGLFVPILNFFLIYRQFNYIKHIAREAGTKTYSWPAWLAIAYSLLKISQGISWSMFHGLSIMKQAEGLYVIGGYLLMALLAVGILIIVQITLNRLWKKEQPELRMRTKFSWLEIALLVVGVCWYAFLFFIDVKN